MIKQYAPLTQATALDSAKYSGSAYYNFDLEYIIGPNWQCIAPAKTVNTPGDVITRDIAGVPVVIVRSMSGKLNGFYNICRHRAGPLATCDKRGVKRLRCGYHGWTYDLDGQLTIAPEMRDAENFDIKSIRLNPIDVKEWGGLIFARIGKGLNGAGLAFDDVFDGISEIADDKILADMEHQTALEFDVACNWKVYVDNFLEGYHLPFVHPGLTELVEYPDYITQLSQWWSLQRSPVLEDSGPYAAGEGLYFFVYPNTMLNIMPGRLQTNRVVPTGQSSCKVEFDFYYTPGSEARAAADLKFSDIIQEEDRAICEHVQKGLTSNAYQPGRLSPARESGVWHWQNLLRDAYSGYSETKA